MSGIAIMAAIILVAVILFVWNRLPVVIVAMGVALALSATGLLTLDQALAGFGDPAVIFIAALFVVSAGLERSGVTAWAGQLLIAGAGTESRARLLLLTMLLVALVTYATQLAIVLLVFLAITRGGAFSGDLARGWLAAAMVLATLVWTAAHLVLTARERAPYFDLPPGGES